MQKMNSRFNEDEQQWLNGKQELTHRIQELYIQLEKTKREAQTQVAVYKQKYSDYKTKVKQANHQIAVLSQKLTAVLGTDENLPKPVHNSP